MNTPSPKFARHLEKKLRQEFRQTETAYTFQGFLRFFHRPAAVIALGLGVLLIISFVPVFPINNEEVKNSQNSFPDEQFQQFDRELDQILIELTSEQ